MTTAQKVIKYIALALAAFIIINIISAILFGLSLIGGIFGLTNNEDILETTSQEMDIVNIENLELSKLDIDLKYSNLIIRTGNRLKVETNNENIKFKENKNQLKLEEKDYKLFSKKSETKVILYIPEDIIFDKVKIEAGAGKLYIQKLKTKELSFSIGAGQTSIENLIVTDKAKIEGGAGNVDILSGTINDLKLDVGVGKFTIQAKLTGDNKINAGIGELNINLMDNIENYTIKAQKGIGTIRLDNQITYNNVKYGDGQNNIDIDGGIGSIYINTNKENSKL